LEPKTAKRWPKKLFSSRRYDTDYMINVIAHGCNPTTRPGYAIAPQAGRPAGGF
jgi:hypothetical protein